MEIWGRVETVLILTEVRRKVAEIVKNLIKNIFSTYGKMVQLTWLKNFSHFIFRGRHILTSAGRLVSFLTKLVAIQIYKSIKPSFSYLTHSKGRKLNSSISKGICVLVNVTNFTVIRNLHSFRAAIHYVTYTYNVLFIYPQPKPFVIWYKSMFTSNSGPLTTLTVLVALSFQLHFLKMNTYLENYSQFRKSSYKFPHDIFDTRRNSPKLWK